MTLWILVISIPLSSGILASAETRGPISAWDSNGPAFESKIQIMRKQILKAYRSLPQWTYLCSESISKLEISNRIIRQFWFRCFGRSQNVFRCALQGFLLLNLSKHMSGLLYNGLRLRAPFDFSLSRSISPGPFHLQDSVSPDKPSPARTA